MQNCWRLFLSQILCITPAVVSQQKGEHFDPSQVYCKHKKSIYLIAWQAMAKIISMTRVLNKICRHNPHVFLFFQIACCARVSTTRSHSHCCNTQPHECGRKKKVPWLYRVNKPIQCAGKELHLVWFSHL